MAKDFYEEYFSYVGDTESPRLYHRWAAVSLVSALLGRSVWLPFGHDNTYPNMYIMLVGNPGARKGSALKPASNALKLIDFKRLAPNRLSPERFLSEMQSLNSLVEIEGIELEALNFSTPSEIYVVAEEFGDFIRGNIDFVRLLTNMWDNLPFYKHPKLHGKNVYVHEPTVNIIGATTQQDMAITIPLESVGQGFLSRFILVYGEPTGVKITIPLAVTQERKENIGKLLTNIKEQVHGQISLNDTSLNLLDRMYKNYTDIDDFRFKHYNTRRFSHLLKLAIVFCAMDLSTILLPSHILHANTLLNATEQRMSKALGEFGKSRNSDVANNVMEIIKTTKKPISLRELWKNVAQDLNKLEDLVEIIKSLEGAEKIQRKELNGRWGYLPLQKREDRWSDDLLCKDFLTLEEI